MSLHNQKLLFAAVHCNKLYFFVTEIQHHANTVLHSGGVTRNKSLVYFPLNITSLLVERVAHTLNSIHILSFQ